MTFDLYGHLFQDAEAAQGAAEDIQIKLLGRLGLTQHRVPKPLI